jgi:hypothetical protein
MRQARHDAGFDWVTDNDDNRILRVACFAANEGGT